MKTRMSLILLAVLICGPVVHAETPQKKKHPRRAQVVKRANREEAKIEKDEAKGKLTEGQANALERQEQAIKKQEQNEARANGGHLTKEEQRELNREETRVDQERKQMEKRNAKKKSAPKKERPSPSAPDTSHSPEPSKASAQ